MLTPWEIKRKGYMPPLLMVQLNLQGLFSLIKILLSNLGTIKKMNTQDAKNVYIRPTPTYTLPKPVSSLKHKKEEQQYLRPTLYCNSDAPEVIALAQQLGAHTKTDREYAEAAFEFAKRKIILEMVPLDDVVDILKRGTGTCIHKISVFIALCRAAGIPARYKFFALTMIDTWMQPAIDHAPLMKKWYDAMGFFLLHGEGEIFLDGKWISADVGAEPQRQAASNLPITKLGEDSIGLWLFPIPGTIIWRESIPLGLGLPSRVLMNRIVPNQIAGINIGILEQIERGKKIIEQAGGETAYDAQARQNRRKSTPTPDIAQHHDRIVFED